MCTALESDQPGAYAAGHAAAAAAAAAVCAADDDVPAPPGVLVRLATVQIDRSLLSRR